MLAVREHGELLAALAALPRDAEEERAVLEASSAQR
jgi:hypothetical protein